MARRRVLAAAIAMAAVLAPAGARALGSAKGAAGSLSARGSLRLLGAFLHMRDLPAPFEAGDDGLTGGELRLLLDGTLPARVGYEVNLYADLSRGPSGAAAGAFAVASSYGATPYRTRYLRGEFWRDNGVAGEAGVDRLKVRVPVGPVEFTIGRFPVNVSVASVFTPNDFFAPFSATTLDRSYKPGVDAARVDVRLGTLSGASVTGVLGSGADGVPSWGRSAVLGHVETVVANFHVSILGGKVAERWVLGAGFQGDVKGVVLRGEGHVGFPDRDGDGRTDGPPHERASLGIEYTFDWQQATIGAEYAFFSDGAASAGGYLDRAAGGFPDDLPYLGRHYAALTMSAEILPILRASLLGMVNAADGSGLGALTLAYSAADEVDVAGGVLAGWGAGPGTAPDGTPRLRSEFGTTPLAVFVQTRVTF